MRERQSKKPADRENGSEKKTETNFIDKNKRKNVKVEIMVRRKIEKPCPIRKELKRVQRMEQEKVSFLELLNF